MQSAGGSPSARERKEIEAQEAFVEELRVMLDEVKRVAPLWRPRLDDGIVLVMAPLWRLVPHKPWQQEIKKKWAELAAGKYDWAQLAMHLWPERVVPKCATIEVSRSPTGSRESSGSKTKTGNGSHATKQRRRSTNLSNAGALSPSRKPWPRTQQLWPMARGAGEARDEGHFPPRTRCR